MAATDYFLKDFPDDKVLEREARSCPMLAYCPDRTFSFCLKKWVNVKGELMFRKVTFKHCYECRHGINCANEDWKVNERTKQDLAAIEARFHDVIDERCRRLEWAKDPAREMPRITEDLLGREEREWFPVPGMYGGFAYELAEEDGCLTLTVESWCRVCEGSEQRCVITPNNTELMEVGFV